jgi:hypothetical protein
MSGSALTMTSFAFRGRQPITTWERGVRDLVLGDLAEGGVLVQVHCSRKVELALPRILRGILVGRSVVPVSMKSESAASSDGAEVRRATVSFSSTWRLA